MMGRWIKRLRLVSEFPPAAALPQRRDALHARAGARRLRRLSGKPVGTLQNAIWQFPFRNLEEVIRKMNRYSTLGAAKLAGKRVSMAGALGHGIWAFLKHYIFKLGFIDGWAGFVIALRQFRGHLLPLRQALRGDARLEGTGGEAAEAAAGFLGRVLKKGDAGGSTSKVVKRHRSRPDQRRAQCVIVRL